MSFQMNQQQLQMLLTSVIVNFANENYVPQVIQMQPVSNNPYVQQCAPILANAVIQRVQQNAAASPSMFSFASVNILGQNSYNNNEFKAIIKILSTVLEIHMVSNPAIAQNLMAVLPNIVAEWLSGALAMMYQKFTHISMMFPMDIQQKIGMEAQRISQLLASVGGGMQSNNMMGMQPGMNANAAMLNMQAMGQVPSMSVPGLNQTTERLFAKGAPAFGQSSNQAPKAPAQSESYYAVKLRQMQNGEINENDNHKRDRSFSSAPPQEDDSPKTPTAPLTLLAGGPEGVVIQSTRTNLSMNAPVTEENAFLFRSNEASPIREEETEPVWDGAQTHDGFVDAMDEIIADAAASSSMVDTFFTDEPIEDTVLMSAWPGIDKNGDLVFKKEIRETIGTDGFLQLLDEYPAYSFAELKAKGLAWYPSNQFPTLPEHETQTHVLHYYPVLVGNGVIAVPVKRENIEENNMNYELHGIGYVPKFRSGVPIEKQPDKIVDGTPPKAFRLKTRIHPEVYLDTCFESSYRAKNVSFAPNPSQQTDQVENVHLANQQPLVAFQPFGFSTEELKQEASRKVTLIIDSQTLQEAAEHLDKLQDEEEIPLRTMISDFFVKQIIRCIQLRGGIDLEFDAFNTQSWETIKGYVEAQMPESFAEALKDAEKEIITEVAGGLRVFNSEEMREQMDAIVFDDHMPLNAHVFYMIQYEQAIFVPQIACELELNENKKSFLIPEKSPKLHAMALEVLHQTNTWADGRPSSCVIITRDGYRIEVAISLFNPDAIVGAITKI